MVVTEVRKLIDGAIGGAAAFVVGLVGSILIVDPSSGDDVVRATVSAAGQSVTRTGTWGGLGGSSSSQPETWKAAGWLYHKAHLATIDVSFSGYSSMEEITSVNGRFVMDVPLLMQLLPVVLLVATGFVLAERRDADDAIRAAIDGGHVVVGYAPVAVLSTVVLSWTASDSATGTSVSVTIEPALVSVLLFTGIAVPLVLGAIGGAINHEVGDEILDAIGRTG